MIVRAIDSSHDWEFGNGKNNYLQANIAIAQNINTRLNCFIGNCFFDLGAGVDWINLLGSSGPNAQMSLNLAISTILLNTAQVTGIIQLSSALSAGRNFSVTYQVQTTYSKVSSTFVFDNSIG